MQTHTHMYPLQCWTLHTVYEKRNQLFFQLFMEYWSDYQTTSVGRGVPICSGDESLEKMLAAGYVGTVLFDVELMVVAGHLVGRLASGEQYGTYTFQEYTRHVSNHIIDRTLRREVSALLVDLCRDTVCEYCLNQPSIDGQPYVLRWRSLYPAKTHRFEVKNGEVIDCRL